MAIRPDEIGNRLRAYRIGQGLSAEQVAERLGVSRAAVYRIEGGEVVKVETLERLADLLNTTVASLLGAGVEYYANSVSYFERMRQLEEKCDQVIAHFPPMSFLLTSHNYSNFLRKTLIEAIPSHEVDAPRAASEIDQIVSILDARRNLRDRRRLSVINFVALPEIERWLKIGVVGRFDLPASEVARRRLVARSEVEHLLSIIESEPMGIQIGITNEILPNMAFQLFRISERTMVGLSPFRLGGELPNIKTGVAMITEDKQPVELYENIANKIWSCAAKGATAAEVLRAALDRSAIQPDSML